MASLRRLERHLDAKCVRLGASGMEAQKAWQATADRWVVAMRALSRTKLDGGR